MDMFIWYNVTNVSERYHNEGGLIVVAANLDEAYKLCREHTTLRKSSVFNEPPDEVYPLAGTPTPNILTFPDAGCC